MAAVVFGERCVRLGNFIDLLRLSSRLRSTVLPWRHIASQKASQTKRSAKGSLILCRFYINPVMVVKTHPPEDTKCETA